MTTTVTINGQQLSRKAAQTILKQAKAMHGLTLQVKGNGKQELLLMEIERINSIVDISTLITNVIKLYPVVEKAAAKPRATKTTKTIEQDNSSAAKLKAALQEIERLKAEAAKPQSDAESRLIDCQRELSETIEALAHANISISNLRETNVELVKDNNRLKVNVGTHVDIRLKQIKDLEAEIAYERTVNTNLRALNEKLKLSNNEVSKKLREAEQTIEKKEKALVIAREQIKQMNAPKTTDNTAFVLPKDELKSEQPKVNVTPNKSEPRMVAEMRAAVAVSSLFADGKPALQCCGVANMFNISDKMELSRVLQRLVSGGFISLHQAPQEYLEKFNADVLRNWTLPNGSFLITLN